MKAKQRTLLILLVLVVLAGGAFALLHAQNEKAAQAESAAAEGTIPLSSFSLDDLTEIVVVYNGETHTLDYAEGAWTLAEDPAYHLDATACNTMATALSALNAKREITEEPGEEYGFTADSLTVSVTAAGETNQFVFGAANSATGDLYLKKAGEETLYTVEGTKASCFELSRAELFGAFNPAGLTSSAIEAVDLTRNGTTLSLTAVSEQSEETAESESASDSTTYTTVWRRSDDPEADLDESTVSAFLTALSSYVTAQDTNGTTEGMTVLAEVRVRTADGTKDMTYYEGTDGYYLTVAGDPSLYSVDGSTVQTICGMDAA